MIEPPPHLTLKFPVCGGCCHGNTNHRQDNALLVLALQQAGQLQEVSQADELYILSFSCLREKCQVPLYWVLASQK